MPAARAALFLLLFVAMARADAADRLRFAVEHIAGAGWRAAHLEIVIDLTTDPLTAELALGSIELPDASLAFEDVAVRCGRVLLTPAELACRDGALTVALPDAAPQEIAAELVYVQADGTLHFTLRDVALAGGTADLSGSAASSRIRVELTGTRLDLEQLAPFAARFAPEIAAFAPTGVLDVEASFAARDGAPAALVFKGAFREASFSNEAGTVVAAGADAAVDMHVERAPDGWRFAAELAAGGGEAYVEPLYANLAETPVHLSAAGTAAPDFGRIALAPVALRYGELVAVGGELDLRLPAAADAAPSVSGVLRLEDASVDALYSGLLQVFAAGTLFGELETAGTVSGSVRLADNAPAAVDLVLEDVFLDDREGRLSIAGLTGELHWPGPGGEPGDAPTTTLRWQAAGAYSIPFGGATASLQLGGDDLELLAPLRVPTMGGAVRIERLAVSNFGRADASGVLDAELEPIQLGQLTAAFGWPAFSGTLSGRLPLLRYDGGVMTLGGALAARAFDGEIEIANLRLEEPFGLVPRLAGDLRLRNLDLELVTNTFSFGLIQGRLSGDVTGLQLVGWRPVAMDLHLYTPPGDRSRKRISQRAVENLASVGGGGAAAALSSGFMKFFEVFAYEEIGLRCVLENGTCTMSGAGPAGRDELGGGYYIVRGRGLPRIDVVGYRSQVSWSQLVAQLESILESGTPEVR